MATQTLTLRDTDDGFITEEQFAQLPEPDLFCLELEGWVLDRAGASVRPGGPDRSPVRQPGRGVRARAEAELSKLIAE